MKTIKLPVMDRAEQSRRKFRLTAPTNANHLHSYIRAILGFNIPRLPLVDGHNAPFDYVKHAFFEEEQPRDMVVWANRGGGKTQLGAVVTLLDLLFKPGIQIRILGGSFEQSTKMYRYLKRMLESDVFSDQIAGSLTGRFVELTNGSRVEVLSQSERSVRGQRVHKLRCDEVELFEPEIWEAAQLVTRSGRCGKVYVHASIETLSTMHRSHGMMQKLVQEADQSNRRVFRWNVLDTLRLCEPERSCEGCKLWDECRGRAKLEHKRGFVNIDDAIQQKGRVSVATWESEMLCERPSRADTVYPEFDERVHVFDDETGQAASNPPRILKWQPSPELESVSRHALCFNENIAHARQHESDALVRVSVGGSGGMWIGGMDFGFRSPNTLLWGFLDDYHVLHVCDELSQEELIVEKYIKAAEERSKLPGRGRPIWIGADPAGHQRSQQTGSSTITAWKRAGWVIRTQPSILEPGIESVHRRLKRADGTIGLRIHRRCEKLIKAMAMYRYPPLSDEQVRTRKALQPRKDGHDHAADALRYMIVNLDREPWRVEGRNY